MYFESEWIINLLLLLLLKQLIFNCVVIAWWEWQASRGVWVFKHYGYKTDSNHIIVTLFFYLYYPVDEALLEELCVSPDESD